MCGLMFGERVNVRKREQLKFISAIAQCIKARFK